MSDDLFIRCAATSIDETRYRNFTSIRQLHAGTAANWKQTLTFMPHSELRPCMDMKSSTEREEKYANDGTHQNSPMNQGNPHDERQRFVVSIGKDKA